MYYLHCKNEYQRMRHAANQALKCTGLNIEQFLSLAEMDGKTKLQDIADEVSLAAPSLSRIVSFLLENNFAKKLKSKGDDRESYLKMCGKGKRIIEKHLGEIVDILGGGENA